MNKLKISQVQFQASHIPTLNTEILEKSFNNILKFLLVFCPSRPTCKKVAPSSSAMGSTSET